RNEIRHRVRNAVESFGLENPGKHLVLVVHAGVIRALVPNANPKNTESVGITLAEIRDARPEVDPHAPAVRYPNSDVQY
ncbi:MAG: histidine phosphatase family protein, partial [bacterium]